MNQGGEQWIADKLARWEKPFPLYELLATRPADFDEEGLAVCFTAENSKINTGQLIHFALGIFWKASVHSWLGNQTEPRIELGPYSESIRTWLLGESEFPKHIYLVANLSRPQRAQITLNDPYEGVHQGWRSFFLHVPGLLFMLNVGKTVEETIQWLCIRNNPRHPILVSDELTGKFERLLAASFRQARRTRPFLRLMNEINEERHKTP